MVFYDRAVYILFPQGSTPVDAQAIKPKRIQLQSPRKLKRFQNIIRGLARSTYDEETVYSRDALLFRFRNGMLDLRQRLALSEPVECFLRTSLNTESEHVAVRFAHDRELINRNRINAAFAAPSKREFTFDYAVANIVNALPIKQKMIVRQIHGTVTGVIELLHLAQHMLRGTAAPSAFGNGWNIAIDAMIGAPS